MADDDFDSYLEEGINKPKEKIEKVIEVSQPEVDVTKKERSSKRRSRSPSRESRRRRHSRSTSRSRKRRHRLSRRRSKSRSRSRGSRRRSRSYSRSQRTSSSKGSRPQSKSPREKSKSKSPEKRAPSTSAERAEKARNRELMELTRDHRTVFVSQLQIKVKEKDLRKYFEKLGKVEDVLIIRDKFTNRSKGFAYVELSALETVPLALMLSGQVPDFQVFPIMIKASEAEKNFAAKMESALQAKANAASMTGHSESAAASRIYCGNLHTNITEEDLCAVFQNFGEVLSVNINRDETGRSKGFGFIQFKTAEEANFAMAKGNGLELAGNQLKLGYVNEGGNANTNTNSSSWKLDDDDGAGMQMNSRSRTALMAKLAGGAGADFIGSNSSSIPSQAQPTRPVKATQPTTPSPIEGSPSFCFVLKNMFDPATETHPDWDIDIKQDVEDECSKFGKVLHSYVEKNKAGGLVYLLFGEVKSAEQAANSMNGRWFAGRMVTVRYMTSQEYVGMFPEARSSVSMALQNR